MRASDPVRASSSRPRARYTQPSASELSRATPSPAQASSATACNVSSASHSRCVSPSASSSSGTSAPWQKTRHSSATRSGKAPARSSAQALQRRRASSTACAQSVEPPGGPLIDGEGVAKRFRPSQHHIGEREHIRGPLQEPIRDRGSAGGVPSRRRRWFAHALTYPANGPFGGHLSPPRLVTINLAARMTHRRHTPVTGATQPPTVVEHLKTERHGRTIASTPPN